jgi:multicomponent Na+:H+ antiporter subunit G
MIFTVLAWFFFGMAAFFAVIGSLGLLILPDVYTRLQAGGLSGSTAVISLMIGSLLWVEPGPLTGRLLVLLLFFLVSSPTASHIVGRYAWRERIVPWRRPVQWGRREGSDD